LIGFALYINSKFILGWIFIYLGCLVWILYLFKFHHYPLVQQIELNMHRTSNELTNNFRLLIFLLQFYYRKISLGKICTTKKYLPVDRRIRGNYDQLWSIFHSTWLHVINSFLHLFIKTLTTFHLNLKNRKGRMYFLLGHWHANVFHGSISNIDQ
jgi:hypothetical protein